MEVYARRSELLFPGPTTTLWREDIRTRGSGSVVVVSLDCQERIGH